MSFPAASPLVTGLNYYPETRQQPSSLSQRWGSFTSSSSAQVQRGTLPEFASRPIPDVDTRQQTGSDLRVDRSQDASDRNAMKFSLVLRQDDGAGDGSDGLLLQPGEDPSTEFVSSLAITSVPETITTPSLESTSLTVSTPSSVVTSSVPATTSVSSALPTSSSGMNDTFKLGNATLSRSMLVGLGVVAAVLLVGFVVGLLFCLSIRRRRKALVNGVSPSDTEAKYLSTATPRTAPVVVPFTQRVPSQPAAPRRPVNPYAHFRGSDMPIDAGTLRRSEMRQRTELPAMAFAPPTPVMTRPESPLMSVTVVSPRLVSPRVHVGLPTSPRPSPRTPSPTLAAPVAVAPVSPFGPNLAGPSSISPFGSLAVPFDDIRPDSVTIPPSRSITPAMPAQVRPASPSRLVMPTTYDPPSTSLSPPTNFSRPFANAAAMRSEAPRPRFDSDVSSPPPVSPSWLGRRVNAEYRWPHPKAAPPSHPRESPF